MARVKKRTRNERVEAAIAEHRRKQAAQADLAFKTSRWTRTLFEDELKRDGRLGHAVRSRKEGTWEAFNRELFGRLYGIGTSRLEEVAPNNQWASNLHDQADTVPEWQEAAARSRGDSWLSSLGAAAASEVLVKLLPEMPDENPGDLEREVQELEGAIKEKGKAPPGTARRLADLQARLEKARQQAQGVADAVGDGARVRNALRRAGRAAAQAAQEAGDARDLACGKEMGADQRVALQKRLEMSDTLKRILQLAGRFRKHIVKKRASKHILDGSEEVASVTTGDNLLRLLPVERANLVDETRTALLYSRLLERNALQYQLRGTEKAVGGPILFVIDESGSMSGPPNEWAKAVALAMMTVAREQKRPFGIVHFGERVRREDLFDSQDYNVDELMDALEYFSGGGTSIATALKRAADLIEDPGRWKVSAGREWAEGAKSDVVLITDGVDYDTDACVEQVERMKAFGANVYSIGIGLYDDGEGGHWMKDHCADYTGISNIDANGNMEQLDAVFSI